MQQASPTPLPHPHPALALLCSYTPGDTFAKDWPQYAWLAAELAATDREIFPWLIVNFHAVSELVWCLNVGCWCGL